VLSAVQTAPTLRTMQRRIHKKSFGRFEVLEWEEKLVPASEDSYMGMVAEAMASCGSPTPAPTTETQFDLPDELRRLGELRDEGLLTDEEFEAQKQRLLAS